MSGDLAKEYDVIEYSTNHPDIMEAFDGVEKVTMTINPENKIILILTFTEGKRKKLFNIVLKPK